MSGAENASLKRYAFGGLAGCVVRRKARQNGVLIGVYNSEQAGMETDPSAKWMTVCEVHHNCTGHATLRAAMSWLPDPLTWCADCQEETER